MKKKQKFKLNLDSFLGIKAKIKQYFYINWSNVSNNEIPIAEWLEEKPKNITWSNIIKWKNVGDIMVCCTDNKTFYEEDSKNIDIETQLRIINRKSWDEKKSYNGPNCVFCNYLSVFRLSFRLLLCCHTRVSS